MKIYADSVKLPYGYRTAYLEFALISLDLFTEKSLLFTKIGLLRFFSTKARRDLLETISSLWGQQIHQETNFRLSFLEFLAAPIEPTRPQATG